MRKLLQALVLILTFISVVVLILRYGSKPISQFLGIKDRAGIRVESNPMSTVLIDGVEVGKTPFDSDLYAVGEHSVELKTDSETEKVLGWKGRVGLNTGTVTVVNRDLASIEATASGEIISLEKGKGAVIISTPSEAEVQIDGKSYGRTPLRINDLSAGEHVFVIGRTSYLKRSIKATVIEGYALSLIVDLALSDADLTKLDIEPISTNQEVVVSSTPTGFLRVREKPSVNATEVGRVNPGESLTLIEETSGWYRVKLKDGKEGYISSSYARKK